MHDEHVSVSARSGLRPPLVSISARRHASPGGSQHFSLDLRMRKLKCSLADKRSIGRVLKC